MIRIIDSLFANGLLTTLRETLFPILVAATMAASSVVHANTIVGGWGDNFGAVNVLPDGQYMDVEFGTPDAGGHPGIERGTYTWNAINGSFTSQTGLDTNGDWGLSNAVRAVPNGPSTSCQPTSGCVFTITNGVLHGVTPNGNPPEFSVVSVLAWYLEGVPGPGDLIVFDLLPNGAYVMGIDPPSTGYYVYGLYNPITGALTPQGTDLPGGLASAPTHATFSGNDLILTGANGQVTLRAIPEPAAIPLVGLAVVCLAVMRRARRWIPGRA